MCVSFFIVGDNMNEIYMEEAIKQAKKAYKKNDVPVGAVLVLNNKIISKGYNKKEKDNKATAHAEIIAIEKACKKLKTWHLENCILYTTLEPCLMCTGAILQSRIKTIYYSVPNTNFGAIQTLKQYDKEIKIISGILEDKSILLLKKFFQDKRK